ncbi:DinB family protein [Nocardia huaxiensis]|uniref:DinB family protein n=1 Tax=Nocardia huaxiensis TaxID=2755382 RepID=A0A7D6ZW91_9NOCA|nr:DinB family protein [Nocardia huaxiensis]QLY30189.1 DinB family protein [Nocardia huaxiensis]UFS96196.1 DinB family protein [Nocardia huaxiensis]
MTWTAPAIELPEHSRLGAERALLNSLLERGRAIFLWKCSGLNGIHLAARAVEPSSMSLLGLIRHLSEDERGWFRICAAGEKLDYIYCSESNPDGDFDDALPESAEDDYERYLAEIALADKAVAELPLDLVVEHPARPGLRVSVRWIYLHMIEEYGRHDGHADLLRERIDGATGYQAPFDNKAS